MNRLEIVLFFLFLSLCGHSQDSNSVYRITNQLGSTVSSKPIYKGVLYTDFKYLFSKSSSFEYDVPAWNSTSTFNYFQLNAGYGILEGLDLSVGYKQSQIGIVYDSSGHTIEDPYDYSNKAVSIGSKLNLLSQNGWKPELALSGSYRYNSRTNDELDFRFALSYAIYEKLCLIGNLGWLFQIDKLSGTRGANMYASLNLRYMASNGLGFYAEWASSKSYGSIPMSVGLGAFYQLNKNLLFHLQYSQFNEELDPVSPSYNFGGGLTWLMLNN